MSRDRQSLERNSRFQNLILEAKQVLSLIVVTNHPLRIIILCICISQSYTTLQEQQIRTIVYGDDIDYYAEKLTLLDTYYG